MKPPPTPNHAQQKRPPAGGPPRNLRVSARTKSYLRGAIPPNVTRLSAPSLATAATPMK